MADWGCFSCLGAPTPTHQLMAENAEPLKEVLLGQFGKTFPKFKECVFPNKKKQSFGNHLGMVTTV